MRLPNFRRLLSQDYQADFKGLIDTLSGSLNYGIEVLYSALNNNISLKDNIACTVAEFNVEVTADGTPKSTTSFKLKSTQKVEGLIVISAINTADSTIYPPGAVFVNYTGNSDTVIINNIKGLSTNVQYRIKAVAFN